MRSSGSSRRPASRGAPVAVAAVAAAHALWSCSRESGSGSAGSASGSPASKAPVAANDETATAPGSTRPAESPSPSGPGTRPCTPAIEGDCERSCLAGNATDCGFADGILGNKYRGHADDPPKRAMLNRKGCDLGDGRSCSRLGTQYKTGDGVPQDFTKAIMAWESGCSAGYGNACSFAATYYSDPRDFRKEVAGWKQDITSLDFHGAESG